MRLTDYLKKIGDERAAEKFGVTRRRIESWRLGTRQPRPAMAQRIVAETDGLLTLDDIYAPAPPAANEGQAANDHNNNDGTH
jgi:hypothetical protein